jgi:hypothetical protein
MVSIHIAVKYVIRHSVNRASFQGIKTYIVVNAGLRVMCVIRHSG